MIASLSTLSNEVMVRLPNRSNTVGDSFESGSIRRRGNQRVVET